MNESIKHLLSLQERDLELERLRAAIAAVPREIATIQGQIAQLKANLENSKKELTQLQLNRKEKEIDLETKETAIRKHAGELNAVKTNEAYRALMGEIDKIKEDKSALEDSILQVMEQMDQAQRTWKEAENVFKANEGDKLRQISDAEAKQKDLEGQLAQKTAERNEASGTLPKPLLNQYERLKNGIKGGAAVVPVRNEQCSGCHMKVSQNSINEIRRGQKLISCESCSRIIYLEEVPVPVNRDDPAA